VVWDIDIPKATDKPPPPNKPTLADHCARQSREFAARLNKGWPTWVFKPVESGQEPPPKTWVLRVEVRSAPFDGEIFARVTASDGTRNTSIAHPTLIEMRDRVTADLANRPLAEVCDNAYRQFELKFFDGGQGVINRDAMCNAVPVAEGFVGHSGDHWSAGVPLAWEKYSNCRYSRFRIECRRADGLCILHSGGTGSPFLDAGTNVQYLTVRHRQFGRQGETLKDWVPTFFQGLTPKEVFISEMIERPADSEADVIDAGGQP
jgi:hypothetical protein